MRVVVAGLYRSGSTALYNIARLICEADGETYGCFEADYDRKNPAKHHVVKAHRYREELTDSVVLTSYRDLDEVKASMERCQEIETMINGAQPERLSQYVHWLLQWQAHSSYMMHYERLMQGPHYIIGDVSKALGLQANGVERKFARLAAPKEGIDPVTLLHANHRS